MNKSDLYRKMTVLADYLDIDIDDIEIETYNPEENYVCFKVGDDEYTVTRDGQEFFNAAVNLESDLTYDNLYSFGQKNWKNWFEDREITDIVNGILKDDLENTLSQGIMEYILGEFSEEKLFRFVSKIHKINLDDFEDYDDDEFYEYLRDEAYDYFYNKYENNPIQFYYDYDSPLPEFSTEEIRDIARQVVKRDGPDEWYYGAKHIKGYDGRDYVIDKY